jgi:hypothetical protein
MRKLVLIAAMTLASAAANAGPSRSLSLATADATPQVTAQPGTQAAEPAPPTATVERPQPVAPQAANDPAAGDKPAAVKPRQQHVSTEAHIIHELHRHGIYW